jgi:hypothetical protein
VPAPCGEPTLVSTLSALLTPLIAVVATYIAFQQWQATRLKIRLDRYDRRLKIYEQVRTILSKVMQKADISYEDLLSFYRECSEADFLFGPEISQYIEEIYKRGVKLHHFREQYRDSTQIPPAGYDHQQVVEGSHKELLWFNEQFEPAKTRFRKYLDVSD